MYTVIHVYVHTHQPRKFIRSAISIETDKREGERDQGGGEDLRLFVHSRAPHAGRFSGFVMEI